MSTEWYGLPGEHLLADRLFSSCCSVCTWNSYRCVYASGFERYGPVCLSMPSYGLTAAPELLSFPVFLPVFRWPSILLSGHCRDHLTGLSDSLSSFLWVFPKLSCFHFCLHFWWLPILQRETLTFLNTAWNSFLICHNLLLQCRVLPFCHLGLLWLMAPLPSPDMLHTSQHHAPHYASGSVLWDAPVSVELFRTVYAQCTCYHLCKASRAFCCHGWSFASLQGPFWSPRILRVF